MLCKYVAVEPATHADLSATLTAPVSIALHFFIFLFHPSRFKVDDPPSGAQLRSRSLPSAGLFFLPTVAHPSCSGGFTWFSPDCEKSTSRLLRSS